MFGRTDGAPIVTVRSVRGGRGWFAFPPQCRERVRACDVRAVYPADGAWLAGIPLGTVTAEALLSAGAPEAVVEKLRPLLGRSGSAALEILEDRARLRGFRLTVDEERALQTAYEKVFPEDGAGSP